MTAGLDAQYYYLPTEKEDDNTGYKYGNFVKTAFWMDVEAILMSQMASKRGAGGRVAAPLGGLFFGSAVDGIN